MRKIILSVVLAIGLTPQFAGSAKAGPTGGNGTAGSNSYMISRDNTVVFTQHRWGRITHCRVNRGTRVQINKWYRSGRNVTVIGGPHSGCRGDVNNWDLVRAPAPKRIFTNANWGRLIPVFKDRDSFYNARRNRDNPAHNGRLFNPGSIACEIDLGTEVDFEPYRDWGVGQVTVLNGRKSGCQGWVDRNTVQ